MKTVDHSYEQALIMHDNVHIHVIMNIIVTPSWATVPVEIEEKNRNFKMNNFKIKISF